MALQQICRARKDSRRIVVSILQSATNQHEEIATIYSNILRFEKSLYNYYVFTT